METYEQARDLLKRKKRASEYASYCADIGCCNYDGDVVLVYQPESYWKRLKEIVDKKECVDRSFGENIKEG
jgi:hypothetical protein